jgi:hypothetical protein
MKALNMAPVLERSRDEVHRARPAIDDRRADDADVAAEVPVVAAARAGHVGGPRRPRGVGCVVDVPERLGLRRIVGVERVDAIVHRRGEDHVAQALAIYVEPADNQELSVDFVVDSAREQLAECLVPDIACVERLFMQVQAGASDVVALCQHVHAAGARTTAGAWATTASAGYCGGYAHGKENGDDRASLQEGTFGAASGHNARNIGSGPWRGLEWRLLVNRSDFS